MNKILFGLGLLLVSSGAFAIDEVGFFDGIAQNITDISTFFGSIPDFITRLFADFISWIIYWKIKAQIAMVGIAYQTSQHLINDLNVTALINQAFTNIPPSIGHYINVFKIPDCISFLLDCYMTRFVLAFMGVK